MQFGRFLSFALSIVVGGLLQLWVLLIALNAIGHVIDFSELLGDGGLFFFATSLSVGSAISLFDHRPIKVGSTDFNVILICCVGVLVMVVVYYAAVLSGDGMSAAKPFRNHALFQIACALTAMGYWFYAGHRTGLFVKKEDDTA